MALSKQELEQQLTVDYKTLMAQPFPVRAAAAQAGLADIMAQDLKPNERAAAFPKYYLPDAQSGVNQYGMGGATPTQMSLLQKNPLTSGYAGQAKTSTTATGSQDNKTKNKTRIVGNTSHLKSILPGITNDPELVKAINEQAARLGVTPASIAMILKVENPNLQTGISGGAGGRYNGLFQMGKAELASMGHTPESYRALSAAEQTKVWGDWLSQGNFNGRTTLKSGDTNQNFTMLMANQLGSSRNLTKVAPNETLAQKQAAAIGGNNVTLESLAAYAQSVNPENYSGIERMETVESPTQQKAAGGKLAQSVAVDQDVIDGNKPYVSGNDFAVPVYLKSSEGGKFDEDVSNMDPDAIEQLKQLSIAAKAAGLVRVDVIGGKNSTNHKSHAGGTEFDLIGYNPDGSVWSRDQRALSALGAMEGGADRFGFYDGNTLHMGSAAGQRRHAEDIQAAGLSPGPAAAWGPGGKTSDVGVGEFNGGLEQQIAAYVKGQGPKPVDQRLIDHMEAMATATNQQSIEQTSAVPPDEASFSIYGMTGRPDAEERARIRENGGIVINMDSNAGGRGQIRPEVIIPDDATPEMRQAAQDYVDRIAELYTEKTGVQSKQGAVLTRSENASRRNDGKGGRANTIHTEPFNIDDPNVRLLLEDEDNRRKLAEIEATTLGRIPGATFSLPHGGGLDTDKDRGAHGELGDEVSIAQTRLGAIQEYQQKVLAEKEQRKQEEQSATEVTEQQPTETPIDATTEEPVVVSNNRYGGEHDVPQGGKATLVQQDAQGKTKKVTNLSEPGTGSEKVSVEPQQKRNDADSLVYKVSPDQDEDNPKQRLDPIRDKEATQSVNSKMRASSVIPSDVNKFPVSTDTAPMMSTARAAYTLHKNPEYNHPNRRYVSSY